MDKILTLITIQTWKKQTSNGHTPRGLAHFVGTDVVPPCKA